MLCSDEDPKQGIIAKDPSKHYKPDYHVCFGSTVSTQYISTTADYGLALEWARKTNNRIVSINVRVAMNEGVQVLDLRDRNNIYINGETAKKFAAKSAELLLFGADVPSRALTLKYHPCSN